MTADNRAWDANETSVTRALGSVLRKTAFIAGKYDENTSMEAIPETVEAIPETELTR